MLINLINKIDKQKIPIVSVGIHYVNNSKFNKQMIN